jgi:hypothetical protein
MAAAWEHEATLQLGFYCSKEITTTLKLEGHPW